jgi:hypothetical protein
MTNTATITLAGVPYTVPRLNIAQHRKIATTRAETSDAFAYVFIEVAMERADPKPANFDDLEPTLGEITAAVAALNILNGIAAPADVARN